MPFSTIFPLPYIAAVSFTGGGILYIYITCNCGRDRSSRQKFM